MVSENRVYCSLCETLLFNFEPEVLESFYKDHIHPAPHKLGKVYPWIEEESVDPLNGRCIN